MQGVKCVIGPACVNDLKRSYEAILDHILRFIRQVQLLERSPENKFGTDSHTMGLVALGPCKRVHRETCTCQIKRPCLEPVAYQEPAVC